MYILLTTHIYYIIYKLHNVQIFKTHEYTLIYLATTTTSIYKCIKNNTAKTIMMSINYYTNFLYLHIVLKKKSFSSTQYTLLS